MKKENKSSNRIKFVPQETMDAIPILDSNGNIIEEPIPSETPTQPQIKDLAGATEKISLSKTEISPKETFSKLAVSKLERIKDLTLVKIEAVKNETLSKIQAITKEVIPSITPELQNQEANSDKPSAKAKYSLQLKMMLVISIVIAVTVSVIIALATYFFKEDNEIRIRDNNLELVRIVKSKVVTDLISEIDKAKILALTLKQEFKSKSEKKLFIDQYFKNDNSFIYLGVYKKVDNSMEAVESIFNQDYFQKKSVSEEDILNPINKNLPYFLKSFDGVPTILNTSPEFQESSICISIPAEEGEKSEFVLVILLKSERILDAFKKTTMNTTYMVNGEGVVLAHSDK